MVFTIAMLYKSSVFNANSVEPDQTPRSAASDLGLHALQMSLLGSLCKYYCNYYNCNYYYCTTLEKSTD